MIIQRILNKQSYYLILAIAIIGFIILGCEESPNPINTDFKLSKSGELANLDIQNSEIITFSDRTIWEGTVVSPIFIEDFESDPMSYDPLQLPYMTAGGFLLGGILDAVQILPNGLVNGSQELHFRDFSPQGTGTGLSFTFPNSTFVVAFGFDWDTAYESWELHAENLTKTLPAGSKGFIGVVSTIPLSSFVLTSSSYVQGGISVDNISYSPVIIVPLDIKPQSCPNPLNTKSKGILPAAILGTVDFDVTHIDPASITLEGLSPLRWNYEDVATPFEPFIGKENCNLECNNEGPDGLFDLTLKFDTQQIVVALGDLTDRQCKTLVLTGNLKEEFGELPVIGEDIVLILKK